MDFFLLSFCLLFFPIFFFVALLSLHLTILHHFCLHLDISAFPSLSLSLFPCRFLLLRVILWGTPVKRTVFILLVTVHSHLYRTSSITSDFLFPWNAPQYFLKGKFLPASCALLSTLIRSLLTIFVPLILRYLMDRCLCHRCLPVFHVGFCYSCQQRHKRCPFVS